MSDPRENRLYRFAADLPDALWDDLAARPASEAAAACQAELEGGLFHLNLVGRGYVIDAGERRLWLAHDPAAAVSYQAGLVLLTALAKAMDLPPAGHMVSFLELPGGSTFFTGPHALPTAPLEKRFGSVPADLTRRIGELGGQALDQADASGRLAGLPRVPLYVLLWAGDEEFPAKAALATDQRAHYHLPLDGLWALANLFVGRLLDKPDA